MAEERVFFINFRMMHDPRRNIYVDLDAEEELNDLPSILQDLCKQLEGRAQFVVKAFDDVAWPVDVKTDFSVFLEQAPKILEFMLSDTKTPFVLDFYEQGIERELIFINDSDNVIIACKSRIAWKPNREKISLSRSKLAKMLIDVFVNFADAANKLCTETAQSVIFREWLKGIQTNLAQMERNYNLR